MNRANVKIARWALLLSCLVLLARGADAQPSQPNLEELVEETQKTEPGSDLMTLVWWMPEQFWQAAFSAGDGLTEEGRESMLKALRPYTLIAVFDGKIGPMGGVTYRPESEIRKSLALVDQEGNTYRPLPDDEIGADVRNFIAAFKPMAASMLGPMGENLHIYAFPAKSASGRAIADPTSEGKLVAKLAERSYTWRLPLGSLMPPKMCPQDRETMSGAWTYCPWHGTKLVPAAPPPR